MSVLFRHFVFSTSLVVCLFAFTQAGSVLAEQESGEVCESASSTCSVDPSCSCSGASCAVTKVGGHGIATCKNEKNEVIKFCIGTSFEGVEQCACADTKEEAYDQIKADFNFESNEFETGARGGIFR